MLWIGSKKKALKYKEMTPKIVQFCNDPQQYPLFLHTPKNIPVSENFQIQNFEPQKMTRAYVYIKISEYIHPLGINELSQLVSYSGCKAALEEGGN